MQQTIITEERSDQRNAESQHLQNILLQYRKSSDKTIHYFLAAYFLFGLCLAFFYDTWLIATGIGGLALLAFYSTRLLLPNSNAYQYVLSVVLGIFMAQFIYQMHGMFEMHFVAFISSAVLIIYQNWRLQIPLTIVVIAHHALFGYLQFSGASDVYFTSMPYMDVETFVIHILLAGIVFFIGGLWAYRLNKYKIASIGQTFQLGLLLEKEKHNEEQRRSQERIAKSEANLRGVFNNTDVGFILMDLEYRLISFNGIASTFSNHIMGHPLVAGGSYLDHVPENRKEMISSSLKRVLNREVLQYEIDYPGLRNAGQLWLHISMHPVTDDRQNLIGISVSLSNISQIKRHEQQLASEKAKKQIEITEAVFIAQEKERSELGRELHDNVNQLLAAATLYTQTARRTDAERDELLKTSETYTKKAVEEIRKLSKHLVTPRLNDFGLINSIRGIAEDLMLVHELRINISSFNFEETHYDEKFKLNILRIVQEQINNTLKYAQAENIDIHFSVHDDHLLITTSDDGVGFSMTQRTKGVGLTNMISRTELYRGEITFDAAPDQGCFIAIRFPLAELGQDTDREALVA
ncbi:histidine kinase [Terrimonas sp. NA20]|uniref:histidine kinase n=1 Tax=Terrimonas ginsenosidimutans TaxID=2908004 RepID=A0ABS9KMK3_9BACT|nr:ATP-binding protein [Terrimonas ginsenosidimutans]MCG2613538.1 histidine kinase [Terrimonas ginsenosidimutans]